MLSAPWFNNRSPPGQTPPNQYTPGICTLIFDPLHATQSLRPSDANTRQWGSLSLVGVMVCRLFGAKPLPEPMRLYCQFNPKEQHCCYSKMRLKISPGKYRLQSIGIFWCIFFRSWIITRSPLSVAHLQLTVWWPRRTWKRRHGNTNVTSSAAESPWSVPLNPTNVDLKRLKAWAQESQSVR